MLLSTVLLFLSQYFKLYATTSTADLRPLIKDSMAESPPVEYSELVTLPSEVNVRSKLRVKYLCRTSNKLTGISIVINTSDNQSRTFHRLWRCAASESVRIRQVRLPNLADDIAYRPSFFNPKTTLVESAVLVSWIVAEDVWQNMDADSRLNVQQWTVVAQNIYQIRMTPPYSRPRGMNICRPWYWKLLLRNPFLSDSAVCQLEIETVTLLNYPAAMNGLAYGIPKDVSPFSDVALESDRRSKLLSPSFSIEIWLYILEYCPAAHINNAGVCGILVHTAWQGHHLTPALLIKSDGRVQIESRGPDWYSAHLTSGIIPRHQWVRLLFTMEDRKWELHWSFSENHNQTYFTFIQYDSIVAYDDTEGQFIFGGVDKHLGSFLGYLGRVRLYRGRVLTMEQLPSPNPNHVMFQLGLNYRSKKCTHFCGWLTNRLSLYSHQAVERYKKDFCPSLHQWFLGRDRRDPYFQTCPKRSKGMKSEYRMVARLLRSKAALAGSWTKHDENFLSQKLLDHVTQYIAYHGLEKLTPLLPLLQQAACLGNSDAAFVLATLLNNGVGSSVKEIESITFHMLAVLSQHRLSSLALGHRHLMGIDGVPFDPSAAYMYYKYIGDMTRDDREHHKEEQVETEMVRLIDEVAMQQQTDEKGDLFLWLKHQAQQGVTSAQVQLGQLLFWGSQGVKRNLQAARELFQQGAEQGDMDSVYNLGLMHIKGQGVSKKNETEGITMISRAAEMKFPNAVTALGWIALEQEKNFTKAAVLFEEAHLLGHLDSGYYLGHLYHHGLYPNKSQDIDKAMNYYLWSASQGHVNAGLWYAYLQSRGTFKTPRNMWTAVQWARFIAEKNAVVGRELRAGVHAYREGNM